jgi:hypothetical protein
MAEIELSVLNCHGLSDRIPTMERMEQETTAWNRVRNEKACQMDWRLTIADAWIKLKKNNIHNRIGWRKSCQEYSYFF